MKRLYKLILLDWTHYYEQKWGKNPQTLTRKSQWKCKSHAISAEISVSVLYGCRTCGNVTSYNWRRDQAVV
ncbi:4-hydroxyphenylacetate decarboxylase activating enzyme [Dirofilaria immitis]